MSDLFDKAVADLRKTMETAVDDDGLSYAEKTATGQRATMTVALVGIGRTLSMILDVLRRIEEKL